MSMIFRLVLILFSLQVAAQSSLQNLFGEQPQYLTEQEAFQFSYQQVDDQLILNWQVADGYYLYQKQLKFVTKDVELGSFTYPLGEEIDDEFFGLSTVYFDDITLRIPIDRAAQDGQVKVRHQGCAKAGLCYPATVNVIYLDAVLPTNTLTDTSSPSANLPNTLADHSASSFAAQLTNPDNLLVAILAFVLLGIGLGFTPCVFPMYPIVSSIIVGQRQQAWQRVFVLVLLYVQGMAVTYSLLGLAVAQVGVSLQASLQHPIILLVFALLFIFFALALFGLFEIQLPSRYQEKLNQLANQQTAGSYLGVFAMGAISGLLASPCTTAPLAGILLFIAQSGDHVLGFSALYALSIGMGIPLIAFALGGHKLMPKAGMWMNIVKTLFGFMLLAVAIVFIERLWASPYSGILWSLLGISLGAYLFHVLSAQWQKYLFGFGIACAALWLPNQHLIEQNSTHPAFITVRNYDDLQVKLALQENDIVMLDLYADWCVACKEFEKYTFTDPRVHASLSTATWMQIDLTDNTPDNLAFQKEFKITGLPTILFLDRQGREIANSRVTGFMDGATFSEHIERYVLKQDNQQ